MVPAEFLTPSPRMAAFATEANDKERRMDLDLLEERKDAASAWVALYKNILTHYYNARAKYLRFKLETLSYGRTRLTDLNPRGS